MTYRVVATLDSLGLAEVGGPEPPRGYAIQCRVNLETMQADGTSVPGGGVLTQYEEPGGRGIRVDSFGYAGYETSRNFDSLLAKLICHSPAPDYASAVSKTRRALLEFKIAGVETNVSFMLNMLALPSFQANDIHTAFIADNIGALLAPTPHAGAFSKIYVSTRTVILHINDVPCCWRNPHHTQRCTLKAPRLPAPAHRCARTTPR